MSFLSDLSHGNFSNLGSDLAPSNLFSDFGTDFDKQPGWAKGLEIGAPLAIGTALTFGADLPFLGAGAAGGLGAADSAAAGGIDALATIGPGAAADAADAALPAGATLDALGGGAAGYVVPGYGAIGDAGGIDAAATIGPGTAAAGAPLSLTGAVASPSTGLSGILSDIATPSAWTLKGISGAVGAAGLGASLYSGYEQKKALTSLNNQETANAAQAATTAAQANAAAAPLLNSGQALTTYLQTGTLPPDFQAQVKQQVSAAKASIIQGYASRGQNSNPQQNSALAQDLQNVDLQSQSLSANLESTLASAGNQMVQTANSLLASGLSGTQLASEIPIQVSQLNMQLNSQISGAISNFAAAINNGVTNKNSGVTLTIPNNVVTPSGGLNA